jgi:hypothetical protein
VVVAGMPWVQRLPRLSRVQRLSGLPRMWRLIVFFVS